MKTVESLVTQGEIIRLHMQATSLLKKYRELLEKNATLGERKCVRIALKKLYTAMEELENNCGK